MTKRIAWRTLMATLATSAVVVAQERSDLMPKVEAPVANAPRAVIPGVTPPAAGQEGTATPALAPEPVPGASLKGRGNYVLGPEDMPRGVVYNNQPAPASTPATAPQPTGAHLVSQGDTLWGIATQYFGNPGYWPKLWSLNPSITNPHWIYPGDSVRLGAGNPAVAAPSLPPAEKPSTKPRAVVVPSGGVVLRQTGFVEPSELAAAGTIVGSREEKAMLATLDEVYVEPKKNKPLVAGERYTIFRKTKDVKHPGTGKLLGAMVEILGEVEVNNITEKNNVAKASIVDALNPIERGDRVGPLRRQYKLVDPVPAKVDREGVVLAALRLVELVGNEMLVFIDRGKEDGVEVGNRFEVVRRGDGYQATHWQKQEYDKRFPREQVGEVLILEVRDHVSTGIVVHQIKEARVGDRVEMRKGK